MTRGMFGLIWTTTWNIKTGNWSVPLSGQRWRRRSYTLLLKRSRLYSSSKDTWYLITSTFLFNAYSCVCLNVLPAAFSSCFCFSLFVHCVFSICLSLPLCLTPSLSPFRPFNGLFDCKFFFTLDRQTCYERRQARTYDPPDPPGFFEQCIWPMYLQNRQSIDTTNVIQVDGTMNHDEVFKLLVKHINSIQVWWCKEKDEFTPVT